LLGRTESPFSVLLETGKRIPVEDWCEKGFSHQHMRDSCTSRKGGGPLKIETLTRLVWR